jgi:hypothetical protein
MRETLRAGRLRGDGMEAYPLLTTSAWQGTPIEIGGARSSQRDTHNMCQKEFVGPVPQAYHRPRGRSFDQ